MKIVDVQLEDTPIYYVTTDKEIYNTYRRLSSEVWEVAMGESWESVYIEHDELEKLFQEYMNESS